MSLPLIVALFFRRRLLHEVRAALNPGVLGGVLCRSAIPVLCQISVLYLRISDIAMVLYFGGRYLFPGQHTVLKPC